jgi:hypothetical protein
MLRTSPLVSQRAATRPAVARLPLGGAALLPSPALQPTITAQCDKRGASLAVKAQDDTKATAVAPATSSFEQGEGLLELDQVKGCLSILSKAKL